MDLVPVTQDAALVQAGVRLAREVQEAQARRDEAIFHLGGEVLGGIKILETQKTLLESANRILRYEIVKLQQAHTTELVSAVEATSAKIKEAASKVQYIENKCKLYTVRGKLDGNVAFAPQDMLLFSTLVGNLDQIAGASCNQLKRYPEYIDQPVARPREETALVPQLRALDLGQSRSIAPFAAKHESLRNEVASLEAAKQALIDKKEMMGAFHARHMVATREKLGGLVRRAGELMRDTHDRVRWKNGLATYVFKPSGVESPLTVVYHNQRGQERLNQRMEKFQTRMLESIFKLEAGVL
jgi:hypothetical protein